MIAPPNLPLPPYQYEQLYMDQLLQVLSLYFQRTANPGPIRGTTLNLNLDSLPTEADVANLAVGDVYRDTSAGDVLKIKT